MKIDIHFKRIFFFQMWDSLLDMEYILLIMKLKFFQEKNEMKLKWIVNHDR